MFYCLLTGDCLRTLFCLTSVSRLATKYRETELIRPTGIVHGENSWPSHDETQCSKQEIMCSCNQGRQATVTGKLTPKV